MANKLYNSGRTLLANFRWDTDAIDEIGVMLVYTGGGGYTFSASHTLVSDVNASEPTSSGNYTRKSIPASARAVATDGTPTYTNLTVTDATVSWTALTCAPHNDSLAVVLFFYTIGGDITQDTWSLLAYYDAGSNIPITTNGGNVTLNFATTGAIRYYSA
jgi:hypothetical protein